LVGPDRYRGESKGEKDESTFSRIRDRGRGSRADIKCLRSSDPPAWLGTLLLSRLPQIILSELGVITASDWSLWWWIITGAALFALTYIWTPVRPLRGYFRIMTMIYVVTIGLSWLTGTSVWVSRFGPDKPWLIWSFGD
jgi:hypothetical protein